MSLAATNWVWSLRLGDANRKLILLKYADHAHDDGRNTWVKPKKVADFAECSERTVQRHLGALLDEGFMREGDPSAFVWPKSWTGPREARYQPIVYDLAMDEETRLQWKAERASGAARRDRHATGGSVRYGRGDTMTPLTDGDASSQVNRGDTMAPLAGDGAEVTDDLAPEVTGDLGAEHEAEVTLVSPKGTVLQPSGKDEPSEKNEPAAAASQDGPGADVVPISKGRKEPDPRVVEIEPVARKIVNDYHAWWKQDRKVPAEQRLVGGKDDFFMLVGIPRSAAPQMDQCHHVAEALLSGYTEKQVKQALADWASGKHNSGRKPQGTVPSRGAWQEALAAVAAGRTASGRRSDVQARPNAQWATDPTGGFGAAALGQP